MTTVINNPGDGESSGSMTGMILGVVVLLVVIGLFFVYALPAMRNSGAAPTSGTVDVNVKLPTEIPSPVPAAPAE